MIKQLRDSTTSPHVRIGGGAPSILATTSAGHRF
jgi:hypothetical protein